MDDVHTKDVLEWVLAGGAGLMGRVMFHAKQVQAGRRKPISWALLWDIPIGIGMGWLALGVSVWLNVPWEVAISISLAMAYLGPYTVDLVFIRWLDKTYPKNKEE